MNRYERFWRKMSRQQQVRAIFLYMVDVGLVRVNSRLPFNRGLARKLELVKQAWATDTEAFCKRAVTLFVEHRDAKRGSNSYGGTPGANALPNIGHYATRRGVRP